MSIFVDPNAVETHRPQINPVSRRLALASLPERSNVVTKNRAARIAELADAVESERLRDETFAPRINAGSSTVQPRFDKARPPHSDGGGEAPLSSEDRELKHEVRDVPAIDPKSKMIAAATREHLEAQMATKRRVRGLWAAHAESLNMSVAGLKKCMADVNIPTDDLTVAKVSAALGVTPQQSYIKYDRFLKVFEAVLQNALAAAPPAPMATAAAAPAAPTTALTAASTSASQPQSIKPQARSASASAVSRGQPPAAPTPAERAPGTQPRPSESSKTATRESTSGHTAMASVVTDGRRHAEQHHHQPTATTAVRNPEVRAPPTAATAPSALSTSQPARRSASASAAAARQPIPTTTTPVVAPFVVPPVRNAAAATPYISKAEREARECTFAPKVNPPRPATAAAPAAKTLPADAKGFTETIERLARARELKVRGFADSLRSEPLATVAGPVAQGPTKPKPFKLALGDRPTAHDRSKPYLFVDVSLPNRRTMGRIAVCYGDTADALATAFASAHGLDPSTTETLCKLLRSKIADFRLNGAPPTETSPARDSALRPPLVYDIDHHVAKQPTTVTPTPVASAQPSSTRPPHQHQQPVQHLDRSPQRERQSTREQPQPLPQQQHQPQESQRPPNTVPKQQHTALPRQGAQDAAAAAVVVSPPRYVSAAHRPRPRMVSPPSDIEDDEIDITELPAPIPQPSKFTTTAITKHSTPSAAAAVVPVRQTSDVRVHSKAPPTSSSAIGGSAHQHYTSGPSRPPPAVELDFDVEPADDDGDEDDGYGYDEDAYNDDDVEAGGGGDYYGYDDDDDNEDAVPFPPTSTSKSVWL